MAIIKLLKPKRACGSTTAICDFIATLESHKIAVITNNSIMQKNYKDYFKYKNYNIHNITWTTLSNSDCLRGRKIELIIVLDFSHNAMHPNGYAYDRKQDFKDIQSLGVILHCNVIMEICNQ
jgi:hypothetical protein